MKRRAAEVAAIKLCKASLENRPSGTRSRDSRASSADKTRDKKNESLSRDKTHSKREEHSSVQEKTQEKSDDATTQSRGRQAVKRKSAGSEDSVDCNRKSSLRSSHPPAPQNSKKTNIRKKNDVSAERSASSSSEADTDDNASSETEVSQPVKQRKLGIINCLLVQIVYKKMFLTSCTRPIKVSSMSTWTLIQPASSKWMHCIWPRC